MDGNVETNQAVNNLNGKIIVVPIADKTLTKEGYAADAKATGDALKSAIKTEDIVNNLTTDDAKKALSAAQGVALKTMFGDVDPKIAKNIAYSNTDSGLSAVDVQAAIDAAVALFRTYLMSGGDMKIEKSSPYLDFINTTTNRTGRVHENNSNNLVIANRTDDDNWVGLWLKPETVEPKDYFDLGAYINGVFKSYSLHGAHNKTTGTYKGNGSATARTIDTKSVGNMIMIDSGNGFAFVTPRGALCVSGTTVTALTSSAAKFDDGVLTLATTENTLNKADGNYYWNVL